MCGAFVSKANVDQNVVLCDPNWFHLYARQQGDEQGKEEGGERVQR